MLREIRGETPDLAERALRVRRTGHPGAGFLAGREVIVGRIAHRRVAAELDIADMDDRPGTSSRGRGGCS